MPNRAHGHLWTIVPELASRWRPRQLVDRPWQLELPAPEGGPGPSGVVRLAGELGGPHDADLFVLVHGLGGDADRSYMLDAAYFLRRHGFATLRLSMRGAGRGSPDFYHAGLGSDLAAVLADPRLRSHPRVFVLGFSLGGHVAARLILRPDLDARLRGAIAICSPLDLGRNVVLLDRPQGWLYRRFVLDNLHQLYERVHGREAGQKAPRFRTIRAWDEATIVPRYGFADVEEYYTSQSAGPRLREAQRPLLFIATRADPMVPAETLEPHLRAARELVDARWLERGGHLGFPRDSDLGLPGKRGVLPQVLGWCARL